MPGCNVQYQEFMIVHVHVLASGADLRFSEKGV